MRKLSGVNFSYTYRLHLVLAIRISFDKNLIYPEIQAVRILMEQKIILICSQFTEYVQHQILYQIQKQIYNFLLSIVLSAKFKTKNWTYHRLKSIAADWVKIWNYATVLYFHKGILPSNSLNFPFKNFSMFKRIQFIAL